jgi:hypothetical protein
MRKFRKRRQRAGFAMLASLLIIVLGITLFLRTEPFQRASETVSVERVAVPMISGAPEAVAEQGQAAEEQTSSRKDAESGEEDTQREQAEAEKPVASVPATNDLWMTIPKLGSTTTTSPTPTRNRRLTTGRPSEWSLVSRGRTTRTPT